jgi:hypothetical protein
VAGHCRGQPEIERLLSVLADSMPQNEPTHRVWCLEGTLTVPIIAGDEYGSFPELCK